MPCGEALRNRLLNRPRNEIEPCPMPLPPGPLGPGHNIFAARPAGRCLGAPCPAGQGAAGGRAGPLRPGAARHCGRCRLRHAARRHSHQPLRQRKHDGRNRHAALPHLFGPVLAPDLPSFLMAGFLFGAMIGSMDVAMNAHGIAVERLLRLPTMSMFHGAYSLGGMAGAFAGAALLQLWGAEVQAISAAAVCLALLAIATRLSAGHRRPGPVGHPFRLAHRRHHCAWPALLPGPDDRRLGPRLGGHPDAGEVPRRRRHGCPGLRFLSGRHGGGPRHRRPAAVAAGSRPSGAGQTLAVAGTTLALAAPSPWIALAAFIFAGLGMGDVTLLLPAAAGWSPTRRGAASPPSPRWAIRVFSPARR